MNGYAECLDIARQELKLTQAAMRREMAEYPSLIAACDGMSNHLLGQSKRICNPFAALKVQIFIPTPGRLVPGRSIESP